MRTSCIHRNAYAGGGRKVGDTNVYDRSPWQKIFKKNNMTRLVTYATLLLWNSTTPTSST